MSRYLFGPVPSRRLGRSLGIDLVPWKTCSYDCIYCQLGRTTCKTVQRQEWVPLEKVLQELKERVQVKPDYITLSGSGEPTLFSRLGDLLERIKTITNIPVAVLTNGSLLWKEDLQRQLLPADLVIPSLDAGNETLFRRVNRPHDSLRFEQMLSGLIAFRRRFRGQYWLEVFLVGAYSTFEAELAAIRRCVDLIQPDRVQLNTVSRPPAERYAISVTHEQLESIAEKFSPPAEIIADFHESESTVAEEADREMILALLRRRPCSLEDLAGGLGMPAAGMIKLLESLYAEGLLEVSRTAEKSHFRAVRKEISECGAPSTSKEPHPGGRESKHRGSRIAN
jgi:wyosine [tRNA(Phe)-imidazoG37] synthetase (radical SAM superfamily)